MNEELEFTLRDVFAMEALLGLWGTEADTTSINNLAELSYAIADCMMRARDEE